MATQETFQFPDGGSIPNEEQEANLRVKDFIQQTNKELL